MDCRRLVLIAAIALGGCERSPRQTAEQQLAAIGPENLRADAARLYKDLFASRAPGFIAIRLSRAPESFRAFKPEHVGAYHDGLVIALEKTSVHEAGLYVIPAGMDVEPSGSENARFERLADGIYWYEFGREASKPGAAAASDKP